MKRKRLKRLFASTVGGSWGVEPGEGEVDVLCIRGTDFDTDRLRVDTSRAPTRGFAKGDLRLRAALDGDVIIEKSGGGEQQPVGRAVLWDGAGPVMPTNFAARLRVNAQTDARFATYLLSSMWLDGRTRAVIKQTTGIQNLDLAALLDQQVSCPSLDLQQAIVDYLDRETARIDALIAAKRRMVGLLKKKRRTLITRYVTRGCDQGSTLTNSGLPWLGEIPSHWPLAKFTRVVSITEGQVDPEVEPYLTMPLIAPNHVESETGILLGTETASDQGAISGKYLCQQCDVIYSKIRPALRKAILVSQACLCSADMYPLRAGDDLDPAYLLYFLLADPFSHWAELESERVAMPKINRESLSDLRIPLPSIDEQRRVVACISTETLGLDRSRMANERSISLLQERRQALITAAVTGQLDISKAA